MEMEQQQREPRLSGAYIRSLVKQLSSSRPKESPPLTTTPNSDHPQFSHHSSPPPPPPPQPPKKQVRRRLHTSRPYQERLLNMAEARREIVTALKFHRASMKQSSQQQQQQQHQTPIPPLTSPPPNPNPNYPYQPYPSFFWAYPSIAPLPMNDAFALPLPNQPLGLNLNFQGFHGIEVQIPMSNNEQIPAASVSASSSSSSVESSVEEPPPMVAEDSNGSTLHPVMDGEDMREIRSLIEQHDMEWNDTVNLVTTAWWSKVLDGGGERETLFDEAAGTPAWLTDAAGGDPAMSWELPHYFEG